MGRNFEEDAERGGEEKEEENGVGGGFAAHGTP
jgi:hypothetical protein